ncbi:hypothetical protein KC19_3G253900 [Ceratodon purpureus]|uniref:Glycoside hydrolase family 76 protein n=1 Tax=Ceratodon purpureus TaxID=3225 RepID=A0A8T0IPD3_CERPU|nr:hypothetical protein KC19_3G253900 [Ceratodon purpureus]
MGFSEESKNAAIEAYNNAFYVAADHRGYYCVSTKDRGEPKRYAKFWSTCEQIEALEDACQRSSPKGAIYKGMIPELVNGLNHFVSGTSDWHTWNNFNDDIMWGVIALVRAYELTGRSNKGFLDQAQIQFNEVWKRGFDMELGGGLWWKFNDSTKTKNACVNFPAIIAAMHLARNTENTGFLSQAEQLWSWSRRNLYNEKTGQVSDHKASDGKLDTKPYTYNQGTFIGAAYLLYLHTRTKDPARATSYLDDCKLASSFTMERLTTKSGGVGILDNNEVSGDDGPGFKGIFARWCSVYAKETNNVRIKEWLTANANMAWKNRNHVTNLMGTKWQDPTPKDLTSWECSSGLSITQNAP